MPLEKQLGNFDTFHKRQFSISDMDLFVLENALIPPSPSTLDGFALTVLGLFLFYILQTFLSTSASLKQRRDSGQRNVFFREFGCLETGSEVEFDSCIQRSQLNILITGADFFFSPVRDYIYIYCIMIIILIWYIIYVLLIWQTNKPRLSLRSPDNFKLITSPCSRSACQSPDRAMKLLETGGQFAEDLRRRRRRSTKYGEILHTLRRAAMAGYEGLDCSQLW